MTDQSTALSMSPVDSNALSALLAAANAIKEVYTLRQTNENLELQQLQDADTITEQGRKIDELSAELAKVSAALSEALARETQLRIDLAETQARLTSEQRLAGQHWADLTQTQADLTTTRATLTTTQVDLTQTRAKLAEAEKTLAHFRDILGVPAPVPQQPVNPLESPQDPGLGGGQNPSPSAEGQYIGLTPQEDTQDPLAFRSSDPHVAMAVDNWYNDASII